MKEYRYRAKPAEEIRRNMSAIRSTGGRAETALRKRLFALGFRYRKNWRALAGKPDIVFVRERVVVFVDGDFWHGRMLRESGPDAAGTYFKKNLPYWSEKLARNVGRDDYVTNVLEQAGWQVVRLWESEVAADLERAVDVVVERVLGRRGDPDSPQRTRAT